MSEANRPRRVVAEIRWGGDPGAIAWVGNRTIHQYWPLLSGYFRDIFLAPQRRAEESAVSWSWREPAKNPAPSAAELAALRKRLTADHQLFSENLTRSADSAGGALRGQGNVDELDAAIAAAVTQLVALSDEELARFVGRTESGLRVHSWGAPVAGNLLYPDVQDGEIGGQVIAGGKPGARHEVRLQNGEGDIVARAATDSSGAFRFQKLASAEYRLFASPAGSDAVFPVGGLGVTLAGNSVTGLILRDDDAEPPTISPRARRWPRRAFATLIALILVGAAGWGAMRWHARETAPPSSSARPSELNSSHAKAPSTRIERPGSAASPGPQSPVAPRADPTLTVNDETGSAEKSPAAPNASVPAANAAFATHAWQERPVVVPVSVGVPLPARGVLPRETTAPAAPASNLLASAGESTKAADQKAEKPANTSAALEPTDAEKEATESSPRTRAEETGFVPPHPGGTTASAASANPKLAVDRSEPTDASDVHASVATPAPLDVGAAHSDPAANGSAGARWFGDALSTSRWVRVSAARWQTRLVGDIILPTQLRPAAESESLVALRERALAEHRARMPGALRDPKMRAGLLIDPLPNAEPVTLRDHHGWPMAGLRIREGRAQVEFAPGVLASDGPCFVVGRANEVLAEFRRDADGWSFRFAPGLRAWQWFALEEQGDSSRLNWRTASGLPLPPAWQGGPDHSRALAPEPRVFVPLDERALDAAQAVALIDDATGWAVAGEIRIAVDSQLK